MPPKFALALAAVLPVMLSSAYAEAPDVVLGGKLIVQVLGTAAADKAQVEIGKQEGER